MIDKLYSRREPAEAQIAVLIDYENVGLDSIPSLLDQVSGIGRIIVKRAYADWAAAASKRDQLLNLGIEAIHIPRLVSTGKNSSDIRMVIDATDLLYSSPVDTFVIASSDSDFVPLVSKLRAAGKTVIGAGRKAVASRTLITACDQYIYLGSPEESEKAKPSPLRGEPEALLVRAVNASVDRQGQVGASKLHQTMTRLEPTFAYRALGYRTFIEFLKSSKNVKAHRESGQGDYTVELASLKRTVELPREGNFESADWDRKVDEAWSKRSGVFLPGPWAASEAARVLNIPKLSTSRFKTLQGLLDASEYLKSKWRRDGNAIIRRGAEQPAAAP